MITLSMSRILAVRFLESPEFVIKLAIPERFVDKEDDIDGLGRVSRVSLISS